MVVYELLDHNGLKRLMVFKSLNGLVTEYLTSKFIKRNESSHSLRDSVNKLVVPFPRTNYMNTFSYSGATLYYSLTCNIRESGSLKAKTCKRTGLNWEITFLFGKDLIMDQ